MLEFIVIAIALLKIISDKGAEKIAKEKAEEMARAKSIANYKNDLKEREDRNVQAQQMDKRQDGSQAVKVQQQIIVRNRRAGRKRHR